MPAAPAGAVRAVLVYRAPCSTKASKRNSTSGQNSEISSTPAPASRPPTPVGPDSMLTPTTSTSASAGFIRMAASIQRSERQNHAAVVLAKGRPR